MLPGAEGIDTLGHPTTTDIIIIIIIIIMVSCHE